jgi:hypothetical protein
VESLSRTSGIGVLGDVSSVGKYATVEGIMITLDGERMISPTYKAEHFKAPLPAPWYMNLNALGGGACGLQEGVSDWRFSSTPDNDEGRKHLFTYGGANNIGLLVKVTGRVGHREHGYFYLEEPANFRDGRGHFKGVRVDWPFDDPMPLEDEFVEIVGISSCAITNDSVYGDVIVRLLRPVSPDSVRAIRLY